MDGWEIPLMWTSVNLPLYVGGLSSITLEAVQGGTTRMKCGVPELIMVTDNRLLYKEVKGKIAINGKNLRMNMTNRTDTPRQLSRKRPPEESGRCSTPIAGIWKKGHSILMEGIIRHSVIRRITAPIPILSKRRDNSDIQMREHYSNTTFSR